MKLLQTLHTTLFWNTVYIYKSYSAYNHCAKSTSWLQFSDYHSCRSRAGRGDSA